MSSSEQVINSFFGTYNHFQRLGWYFDKVVQTVEDLKKPECSRVMTGRFVYVEQEDAIFIRTEGTHSYKRYKAELDSTTGRMTYSNTAETITTEGFKFIGYLTQHARLLLDSNGMFFDFDESTFSFPYKIANDENVKRVSAYYFPTDNNSSIWGNLPNTEVQYMVRLLRAVNIRELPNTYATLLLPLAQDDDALYGVEDKTEDLPNPWYKVTVDGITGWIYANYTEKAYFKIKPESPVDVYKDPITTSTIIGEISNASLYYQIKNISADKKWYYFEYGTEIFGWVQVSDNIELVHEADTVTPLLPDPTPKEDI